MSRGPQQQHDDDDGGGNSLGNGMVYGMIGRLQNSAARAAAAASVVAERSHTHTQQKKELIAPVIEVDC
jgi:hypothetical protein